LDYKVGNWTVDDLVEKERLARSYMKNDQWAQASTLFLEIVEKCPDWEHGEGFYNLGCCYEELKQKEAARRAYLTALQFEPYNPYYLGGFASFLYRMGDSQEAYQAYMDLLKVEKDNPYIMAQVMPAIETLAQRLKRSGQQLEADIQAATKNDVS
jgi:Flp pilus assembly protein TadD